MEKQPDVDAVAKENERLFADQKELDKRVMDGDEDAVQEASDNLAAANALNKHYGAGSDLGQLAQLEMEDQKPEVASGQLTNTEVDETNRQLFLNDKELLGKSIVAQVERTREGDEIDAAIAESVTDSRSEVPVLGVLAEVGHDIKIKGLQDEYNKIGSPEYHRSMNEIEVKKFAAAHSDQLQANAQAEMDDELYRKSHPEL